MEWALSSGNRFTPMVAGDVNGDGISNDRAFVFGPDGTGGSGVPGMEELLSAAPARARACLRAQLDRLARHNSCHTAWAASLDLGARVKAGPRLEGSAHRRVTLWVAARNVLSGLDYLLHAEDELRGWGQRSAVDDRLLTVRGFDPASEHFLYSANGRFGRTREPALLDRVPFEVSVQARLALGTDRVVSEFRGRMRASSDQARTRAPESLRLHLQRQIPNAAAEALALNAPHRLHVTPTQAAALQAAADLMGGRITAMVDTLSRVAAASAHRPPPARELRELTRRAAALRRESADAARAVLTPEQWGKLPEHLREPGTGFVLYPPERVAPPAGF
jgi:hypothetical protein